MGREVIIESASYEEAVAEGLKELGLDESQVDIEVLEEGTKKHFGFGNKPFKVAIRELTEDPESVDDSDESGPDVEDVENDETEIYNEITVDDLTDTQIDAIADAAIETIQTIVGFCGSDKVEIEEYEGEDGELILDIVGDDLAYLIGRHGRTVEALQTVTSAIVTKRMGIHYPLTVDVEGYRHRRKQKVIDIALKAAERAKRSGRSVPLRPMSPQERRTVHIALREVPGVTSTSEGDGEGRHVVVLPTDKH